MSSDRRDLDTRQARRLISEGYYQVSRAYNRLSRAPVGILPEHAMHAIQANTVSMPDGEAGRLYLREHAPRELQVMVSLSVMRAFRLAGGGPYRASSDAGTSVDEDPP